MGKNGQRVESFVICWRQDYHTVTYLEPLRLIGLGQTSSILIIKRYLWKELLSTFSAVFFVLMLILAGHTFVRYMGDAAAGDMAADLVLQLLAIKLIGTLGQLMPFAWFITVILTFGRLYKDNEMTIFSATGLGSLQVLRLVLGPSLLCAGLVAVFTFYVDPSTREYAYQLTDAAASRSEVSGVSAGSFNSIKGSERVFYVEGISNDKKEMYNVFIQGGSGDALDVFSAPRARQVIDPQSGERYLVLLDGYRYEKDVESGNLLIYEYQEASVRIEQPEITPASRKRKAYPSEQLWNSTELKDQAELHWRLAMPVSVILLSLLAVLLSYTTPREGRFAKLFVAVLIYIVYSNLMGIGQSWIGSGKVASGLGLWWVHGLAFVVIILLYVQRYGWYDLLPRRREQKL